MGWPQITYIVLFCIGVGMELERHGKPKEGHYNVWSALLGGLFVLWLLYAGGFFS